MIGGNGNQSKLESELRENRVRYQAAAAPLLAELADAGFEVGTVSDLARWKRSYRKAVPILLKWLPLVEYHPLRSSIIDALCSRYARAQAAPALISAFKKEPAGNWDLANAVRDVPESRIADAVRDFDAKNSKKKQMAARPSCKWQIGNALSYVADDEVFDEIVELARDKRHGHDRQMLAWALGRMQNPKAVDVLIDLLDDDEVAGHAIRPLGKLRATKARSKIEGFLTHNREWVRREARMAIKKIDKAVAEDEVS